MLIVLEHVRTLVKFVGLLTVGEFCPQPLCVDCNKLQMQMLHRNKLSDSIIQHNSIAVNLLLSRHF